MSAQWTYHQVVRFALLFDPLTSMFWIQQTGAQGSTRWRWGSPSLTVQPGVKQGRNSLFKQIYMNGSLFREEMTGLCNAFKYHTETKDCEMAKVKVTEHIFVHVEFLSQLSFLEDPPNGQSSVSVMLSDNAADTLKMHCRGSDRWIRIWIWIWIRIWREFELTQGL